MGWLRGLVARLALRNLRSDWFGTLAAVLGVALGTATVSVVYTLDVNTRAQEAKRWDTNPTAPGAPDTIVLEGITADDTPTAQEDAKEETHEDYQVMRSAIRLGSLSAFLVGALIVFFTFRVVVEQRRREIALLRSLGATPRQVAKIFLLEAAIIGVVGGAIGIVSTPPLSIAAAMMGITTTGRSQLFWLFFPWKMIAFVALVGASTALLGVAAPLRDVLRLDVAKTLRPQFMESEGRARRRPRGVTVVALPLMLLVYVLIRPFFAEVLPSLAFFVVESGLVCVGFLSVLVLVPDVVGLLGGLVGRLVTFGPKAARLLTLRRIQRAGQDFAWSVAGIMLVFALLLGLHIVTRSLKLEVVDWARQVATQNTYVIAVDDRPTLPARALEAVPEGVLTVRFSGRTPWPNVVIAAESEALKRLARKVSPADYAEVKDLGPGKVVLSKLMARRFGLRPGDRLKVSGGGRRAELEVVGISDIGYQPLIGPYRNSKTFATIDEADYDLVARYAKPMGAGLTVNLSTSEWYAAGLEEFLERGIFVEPGSKYMYERVRETDSDFRIFDLILLLTGVLAGLGIANNLVLSAHVRRREIALLRVLGMKASQVFGLFLVEGLFIGTLGGIMAVVLGIPLGFLSLGALELISAFDVQFDLPLSYPVYILISAIAIAVGSALYPALRAARQSSAESVHYE